MPRYRASKTLRSALLAVLLVVVTASSMVVIVHRPAAGAVEQPSFSAFFLRDGRIGTGQLRPLPADVSAYDVAMRQLLAGPLDTELAVGLRTVIPVGTTLRGAIELDEETQTATVDLSSEFTTGDESAIPARMAQVVFTLTQFANIRFVAFKVDGQDVRARSGDGRNLSRPAGRGNYEALLPAIFVESPTPWGSLSSPIQLGGTANTFEATLHVRLADEQGRVLFEDFLTASSGSGTRGRFSGSIAYLLAEPQRGTLVFFQESAKDGSEQDIVAIPVLLDSSPPPPTATPSSVPIQPRTPSPTPSRTPTSTATNTPIPTATRTVPPRPSTTATLLPSNTPRPTDTAQATYTPRPTYTAQPTYTPRPTYTPQPTYTPLPTETPTPTGSLTISTFNCEPGVTIEDFDASRCSVNLATGTFEVAITGNVIAGTLTLDDASPLRNGQYRWSDLPFGTYLLKMTKLPEGYTTYYVPRAPGVEGAPVSGYSVSLDEVTGPDLTLRIYLISGG
ncbi:MAG TPA: Gmad2 immunoglobulin-like domain-containing protein [Thermomicrobiales bacterium]